MQRFFCFFCFFLFFLSFVFLGLQLQHTEGPRPGVKSELQLLASATATAMPDPIHACDLPYSSWQCWILNPLNEARDRTRNLMVPSRTCFRRSTMGTPPLLTLVSRYSYVYCTDGGETKA